MSRVLYLDLKDWVSLTRGRLRRPGSDQALGVYDALVAAVRDGNLVVPLATGHYMKMFNIKAPQQRIELALTMGAISRYVTFTAREILIAHELRRALARILGGWYDAPAPSPSGYGVAHAMGQSPATMQLMPTAEQVDAWVAGGVHPFVRRVEAIAGHGWRYEPSAEVRTPADHVRGALDEAMQFAMLHGPSDQDLPRLPEYGYKPEVSLTILENIRKREQDLRTYLDANPVSAHRLKEFIAARAWFWDLRDDWDKALADVGFGGYTTPSSELGETAFFKSLKRFQS